MSVLGLNDTITPLGIPDANKVTLPAKPYRRLRSTQPLTVVPAPIVILPDELIVNVGAATVKFNVVV